MKNLISFFVLLLFPIVLVAQSKSKIDFFGSVDYSYRYIKDTKFLSGLRDNDKGKINTHFAFHYHRKLSQKWWLKTGMGAALLGYQNKREISSNTGTGLTGGVFDPNISSENFVFENLDNFLFLEIPIAARYEFSKKNKITSYLEGGISPMYYIRSYRVYKVNGQEDLNSYENLHFNKFHVSMTFAFGASYQINERLAIFCQPNFRFHLTKLVDGVLNEKLWSAGLGIGLRAGINSTQ